MPRPDRGLPAIGHRPADPQPLCPRHRREDPLRCGHQSVCADPITYGSPTALSDGVATKKSAFPAKAGIHLSGDGAVEKWIPAFAGNAAFSVDNSIAHRRTLTSVLAVDRVGGVAKKAQSFVARRVDKSRARTISIDPARS